MEKSKITTITVYVPARLNSQRLAQKALRMFNGAPLVSWVPSALNLCKNITYFCVNTESEEIADVVRKYGFNVYMRDPSLAQAETSTEEILADFARGVDTEYIAAINPTNPLLRAENIDSFFEQVLASKADTAFSVSEIRKHALLKNFPINYSPFGPHPRTQDVEPLKVLNWAIVVWRTELVKKRVISRGDSLYLGNVEFITIPEYAAVDIDTEFDFTCAEAIGRVLLKKESF